MNEVYLKFDKTLSGLAGYRFGEEVYNGQVKGAVDFTKDFTIIFPNEIERIASSFTQGFFKEIVAAIGVSGIERTVTIKSSVPDMKKRLIEDLL